MLEGCAVECDVTRHDAGDFLYSQIRLLILDGKEPYFVFDFLKHCMGMFGV